MSLQQLLGEIPKQKFVADYLHRLPFSLANQASSLSNLGTWEVLQEILSCDDVDLMVVRNGQRSDAPDPDSLQQAQQLSQEGHTILVRHAELYHPGLQQLAASFRQDLQAPVNIHMYVTPANAHGFSWHYDAEDVFIVQTTGIKEYSLRKNTVNPWPLEETLPQNMRFERELMPVMRVELHGGDWLYIPNGYWHKAEAKGEHEAAISLAIGVMSRSAIDVLDYLRSRLLDSMLWRQRLPILGDAASSSPEELDNQLQQMFKELGEDLSAQLNNENFHFAYRNWAARVVDE